MRVPSREFRLPGDLSVVPAEVALGVWQAHVVDHPLGIAAMQRTLARPGIRRQWNAEGWDALAFPVVSLGERRETVAAIHALSIAGRSCGVNHLEHEEWGGPPQVGLTACYECPPSLAGACAEIPSLGAIAARYLGAIDESLALLEDGVVVSGAELFGLLHGLARPEGPWEGLAVLTAGTRIQPPASLIQEVRINRGDGVRVELSWHRGRLRWKTCYREASPSAARRISFLLAGAPNPGLPRSRDTLSDRALLPRLWYKRLASSRSCSPP